MDAKKTVGTGLDLPMNVMLEILKRLPAKSLARLNFVCKQWHSWLHLPYFAKLQSEHASRNPKIYVINTWLAWDDNLGQNTLRIYSFSEDGGRVMLSDKFAIPITVKDDFSISNACHGLISFYGARYVFVANPRTRKFRALKEASFHQSRVLGGELIFPNVGLGFSLETGEYKVARVSGQERRCEVLTLGKDVSWRDIGAVRFPLSRYRPAYMNGALYWTTVEHPGLERIVRFDVCREEFTGIELPPSWSPQPFRGKRRLYFGVLWGSLCLAAWRAPLLDLHVIDDNKSTWASKRRNIHSRKIEARLNMGCIKLIDWIKDMTAVAIHKDKVLIFCELSMNWVYHDLRSNTSSIIRLPNDEPFLLTNSRPFACEESIVRVP
ncbi:putative F-box protein [Ananas comosus]|uniref:Putative F-box protein n=1 Tax=Ananas comosus TaxID=4615 RepID=A0A199VRZ5_ANACO|nr:putative F-box protein [Ananas comosus]